VSQPLGTALREFLGTHPVTVIAPHSASISDGELPVDIAAFLNGHSHVVTCIGLFEATYGFDDAVRMLASVRNKHPTVGLILIGNPANSAQCRALINELGLGDAVLIAGNRSHSDCLATLKRAAVLLRPTLFDGDSLSVREALALGVPVVATSIEFRPEGVHLYRRDVPGEGEAALLSAFAAERSQDGTMVIGQENLAAVKRVYDEVWA